MSWWEHTRWIVCTVGELGILRVERGGDVALKTLILDGV
jgi:hypothetical protein